MASTNKTTNYELSQFLGTDKPAWLSDYNQDMSKIDAQMKLNADAATTAGGSATTANTAIGTLANLTTDEKTNLVGAINEVDSHTDTAQSTANAANTTATGCRTDLNKFNLSVHSTLTPVVNLGTIDASSTVMQLATDTTNSIFKVYGRVKITGLNTITGTLTLKLGDSSLNPSTEYVINAGATIYIRNASGVYTAIGSRNIKIATDGTISLVSDTSSSLTDLAGDASIIDVIIPPCLYFNTSFGDA